MKIKKLNKNEVNNFKSLVEIFKEVFEHDSALLDNHHLEKLLENDNFLVFVVIEEDKVIGGLTIHLLSNYYSTKPVAYIYDVAISPIYQGKGFGKMLIAEVCQFCNENNFEDAYVEAEKEDLDAVNFYRKTNFTNEMNAVHFTYSFSK